MSWNCGNNRCWYFYVGPPGEEWILPHWVLIDLDPFTFCTVGGCICAICAPECGDYPSYISNNIKQYIVMAKAQQIPQPNVPGEIPYVLVKPCF